MWWAKLSKQSSVPWDLTCDEIIYCMEGTFRLTCDGKSYICNPGDVLYIPKDNHIAYECDEKCVIFMQPIRMIGNKKQV